MYKLLIVEDDTDIAEAIREQCTAWGLEAHVAEDLRDVTGEFLRVQPHLVLLDITLPFYNGYHWCAELRKLSHVPILFLSSASDNLNIVMAMNMGADVLPYRIRSENGRITLLCKPPAGRQGANLSVCLYVS